MDAREAITEVEPSHYGRKYDSKRRFLSYWHQIDEILSLDPKSVLEIGVGNGFVAKYLRDHGLAVTTLDIDERLHPDVVGSVTKLPFEEASFELVMACEILEHIPYEQAKEGLKEIHRVSSRGAVISLPDATRTARIEFPIPKFGKVRKLFVIPKFFPHAHKITAHGHYWEIGKKGFPLKKVSDDIERAGFKIVKTYRVFENPYHRFFVLEKVCPPKFS